MSTADLIAKMLAADKEKGVDGLKLVHKIVSNIISDQDNAKKRRLKVDNALVKGKVLSLAGGRELLLALGFQPEGAELVLPQEAPLVKLLQARNAIDDALTAAAAPPPAEPTPAPAPAPTRAGAGADVSAKRLPGGGPPAPP